MSDKPTNGAKHPSAAGEGDETEGEVAEAAGAPVQDEDEIPVEVDASDDTRPVDVPNLGAAADAGAAEPVGPAVGEHLGRDDLLEMLGQSENEKTALSERIAELEGQVEALEADKKETYERLLRSAADMENLRKRTRKDVEDARIDARTRVLKEVLPVIDNLDRAVSHAETADQDVGGVAEGVRLVLRQFGQALERCDVHPIDAAGKPFDPNLHEAVSQIESADHDPGTVVEVLQRGYMIGARLLRASLVVVASAPAKPADAPTPMPPADDDGQADAGNGADDGGNGEAASGGNGAAPASDGSDEGGEPEKEA